MFNEQKGGIIMNKKQKIGIVLYTLALVIGVVELIFGVQDIKRSLFGFKEIFTEDQQQEIVGKYIINKGE